MHMRTKKWAKPELAVCPYFTDEPETKRGRWRAQFEREQPLYLELGCGKGVSTAAMVKDNPTINYVAVDITCNVLGDTRRNIEKAFDGEPVKNVMIAPKEIPPSLKTFLIRQKQSIFISPSPGQVIHLDGVTFAVVHTGEGIKNEASAMIRVTYGQHSFLFTGDVEREQETIAVNQGLMTSTVLKVPHHGARTSSSAAFLSAVRPQHAVISVGAANRFGHPHPEVMQRLAETGAKMYRTDRQGAIRFTTDGEKLTVVPYR